MATTAKKTHAKAKPQEEPKEAQLVEAKAQPKEEPKEAQVGAKAKGRVGWEGTRNQFVARTGLKGPGQTGTFSVSKYSSRGEAEAAAHKWLLAA